VEFALFIGVILIWYLCSIIFEKISGKKTIAGTARDTLTVMSNSVLIDTLKDCSVEYLESLYNDGTITHIQYSDALKEKLDKTNFYSINDITAIDQTRTINPTRMLNAPKAVNPTRTSNTSREVSTFRRYATDTLTDNDSHNSSEGHTYENWIKNGYQVKKGEKAAYKYYGKSIFTKDQVVRRR